MKAVLVIDMPESCKECQLKYLDTGDDAYFGGVTERCVIDGSEISISGRYDDCPLRPLPNRLPTFEPTTFYELSNLFHDGFNACLDVITGETE